MKTTDRVNAEVAFTKSCNARARNYLMGSGED